MACVFKPQIEMYRGVSPELDALIEKAIASWSRLTSYWQAEIAYATMHAAHGHIATTKLGCMIDHVCGACQSTSCIPG